MSEIYQLPENGNNNGNATSHFPFQSVMDSFGMSRKSIDKALNILSNYNTGMAVSVPDLKMSAIYISKSTSPSEFYSTAIHECIHVADSILDWYGESWNGESSAYLVGFMTKEIVELIGEPCRI